MLSFARLRQRKTFVVFGSVVITVIIAAFVFGDALVLFSEQRRYRDKIVFSTTSRYQKIVITEFRNHHWLYLDGHLQFATIDEHRYHEPLVHPAMLLADQASNVLLLGGGDGLAAREILRHKKLQRLTVVDIDAKMTELARTHPLLTHINAVAFHNPKVTIVNTDAFTFLQNATQHYDVIIADFPIPAQLTSPASTVANFFSPPFTTYATTGSSSLKQAAPSSRTVPFSRCSRPYARCIPPCPSTRPSPAWAIAAGCWPSKTCN